MADPEATEAEKGILVKPLGRAIQSRRQELQLSSNAVVADLDLSQAYYRSIEAGLVAAPPNVAVPLAFALKWDVAAVAELLAAIRYMTKGNDEVQKLRRSQLYSRGIAAEILNADPETEDLASLIRAHFERPRPASSLPAGQKGLPALIENLPWMFQLTIRKMALDLCRLPFNIEQKYFGQFLEEYRHRIRKVYAYLSYTPWGYIFEDSGYDFSHLHNDHSPEFLVKYFGPETSPDSVKRDLRKTLDRLTANVAPKGETKRRRKPLEDRLHVTKAESLRPFVFNTENRVLATRKRAGKHDQVFLNAWLFEVAADDTSSTKASILVGFIDNYMPEPEAGRRGFFGVPLSLEDAAELVDTLWP